MTWACPACGGGNPPGTRFCGHCGIRNEDFVPRAVADRDQRLVTALFADISGFTALADQLDADQLDRTIAPVIRLLVGVAEQYGGTLAKYAGDAVLVFFGAPVAQEDHATRALMCAGDMHRTLAAALPRLPPEACHLELHIGVNSGRVVAGLFGGENGGDYSILGDAVNVAQRLESVAPAGETYVGETTTQLTERDFELEPLGPLTLKGKGRPVPAWRLLGRKQQLREVVAGAAFIGRESELATIRRIIDGLPTAGLVSVVAEAGQGKSRLLDEVRSHTDRAGMLWLEIRAISYGASIAYWPFIDLLRRSFGIRLEQDPQVSAARMTAELAGLGAPQAGPVFARLLGLPSSAADLTPEAFGRALETSFVALLTALSRRQPLVIAIEDLHWADATSVDLTVALARMAETAPMMVLVTGRPESAAHLDRIAAAFAPERRAHIDLGPLDERAVEDVMTAMLGSRPSSELRTLTVERTGGNPFFVSELVRSLHERGAVVEGPDGWILRPDCPAEALPVSIEGVLAARLDVLPRAAARVLQAASVIGRRVDTALLEAVADAPDLAEILDRLVMAGLLDRADVHGAPQLRFHHALVVDIAYARLTGHQRRDIHRRVGEAAEVIYGTGDDIVDLLARHFYLAEAGVKAVDYLQKAGRRSARLFANDEAILHFRRAIELTRQTERLSSRLPVLLVEIGELEQFVADYDGAERDFDEVRRQTGNVDAWVGLAAVYRKRGRIADSLAVVDQAIQDARLRGQNLSPLWLERTATLTAEGQSVQAIEAALIGLESAPKDGVIAAHLLLRMAQAEEALGRNEDALRRAMEARAAFEQTGDLRGLTFAKRVIGGIQWRLGDPDAVNTLRQALELADRTGSSEEVAGCLLNLGLALFKSGILPEAIDCDRRAIELFERAGNTLGEAAANANLAEKLLATGDIGRAADHCERGLRVAERFGASAAAADAHRTMAMIQIKEGRCGLARMHAKQAHRIFREQGDAASAEQALALVENLSPLGALDQP